MVCDGGALSGTTTLPIGGANRTWYIWVAILCEMFASSAVQIAPGLQIRPHDPTVSWEEEAHDANEVSASILKLEYVEH